MFHAGEFELFQKAGFWRVFFGDALIGERLPQLTYMLSFPDLDQMNAMWDAFRNDPEWKKLQADPRFSYDQLVRQYYEPGAEPDSIFADLGSDGESGGRAGTGTGRASRDSHCAEIRQCGAPGKSLPARPPAGYSGTPLAKKLGVKDGQRTWRWKMPASVAEEIAEGGVAPVLEKTARAGVEMAHVFVTRKTELAG